MAAGKDLSYTSSMSWEKVTFVGGQNPVLLKVLLNASLAFMNFSSQRRICLKKG